MDTLKLFQHSTDFESYSAGDFIFNAGDEATKMYVVKEGEVEIIVQGEVVEVALPGIIFGEMAIVDDNPRSASARAKTDCSVVGVDEKRFNFLVQNTPFFAIHVMRVLANRIRKMNQQN
ncbi:MAG: Crp/Fnr family transcriptional regulator [Thermodesulfobacteriota bacterium]